MTYGEPCRHERFAGTQLDTLTSFIKTSGELVKAKAERDKALATLAEIRTIVADPDAALVVDRVRAALEPTPKGKP